MIEFGCLIMPSIDGVEREYGHFSVESRLDFINIVQYDSPCCIAYNYKIREFKLRDSCVSFTEIGIIIEGRVDSLKVKLNLGSIHKSMAYLHFTEKTSR